MILVDVNVLIYAHREESKDHGRYREWLSGAVGGPHSFGMSELVLSAFIRLVTNPKIFKDPTPIEKAVEFANALRERPTCVLVVPGPRHWEIFVDLCHRASVKGALVSDAYLAALAIESGSEWMTTDRDYARFPGLHWRHPLEVDHVAERGARYRTRVGRSKAPVRRG